MLARGVARLGMAFSFPPLPSPSGGKSWREAREARSARKRWGSTGSRRARVRSATGVESFCGVERQQALAVAMAAAAGGQGPSASGHAAGAHQSGPPPISPARSGCQTSSDAWGASLNDTSGIVPNQRTLARIDVSRRFRAVGSPPAADAAPIPLRLPGSSGSRAL